VVPVDFDIPVEEADEQGEPVFVGALHGFFMEALAWSLRMAFTANHTIKPQMRMSMAKAAKNVSAVPPHGSMMGTGSPRRGPHMQGA
jgi:hypothetical protein